MRLTVKHWRNLDPWECCGKDNFCKRGCHEDGGCKKGCIVPELYDRLAAYEDTGLEPEEITAIKSELDTEKEAICQMCRKRGEEQHILCGCVSCKYGGKQP